MDSSTAYVACGVAAVVIIIMLAWFRQWHTRRRRFQSRQLGGTRLESAMVERLHATNGLISQPMFPPRIYVAMPHSSNEVPDDAGKPEDLPPYRPRVSPPGATANEPPPYSPTTPTLSPTTTPSLATAPRRTLGD
ncbi:hypothetical protein EV175_005225 [Coemansia sp. RSA 1933]|nr:hypothetical protein EV175_005225 [Coemansia sp. RSA 1933]